MVKLHNQVLEDALNHDGLDVKEYNFEGTWKLVIPKPGEEIVFRVKQEWITNHIGWRIHGQCLDEKHKVKIYILKRLIPCRIIKWKAVFTNQHSV